MSFRKCDNCDDEAIFTVTAAYPADPAVVHPTWATYPMPMARVCGQHVAAIVLGDAIRPAATPGYLIRVRRAAHVPAARRA